jgi:hypothetical protein
MTNNCLYYAGEGNFKLSSYYGRLAATKAFDTVNIKKKILDKILRFELSTTAVELLFTLCTRLSACVLWNIIVSSTFPVSNGVRQGGVHLDSLDSAIFCFELTLIYPFQDY